MNNNLHLLVCAADETKHAASRMNSSMLKPGRVWSQETTDFAFVLYGEVTYLFWRCGIETRIDVTAVFAAMIHAGTKGQDC